MINPQQSDGVVRHMEIKAYLDDHQALSQQLSEISSVAPVDRVQNDTFFSCRSGRLKLRSSGEYHDLIYYRRQDDYGPTESFYQSAPALNPVALRSSLVTAFGEAGQVKKFRRSFRIDGSLIHLDRVAGLGDFVEIKTELSPAISAESAAKIVENLMAKLNIDLFQLVDAAYVDLINERKEGMCRIS